MPEFSSLDLRIAPDRIHFLKFVLEGYDGLAVLSTLDPRLGVVRLRFPAAVRNEVLALLKDLAPQLGGLGALKHDLGHD